MRGHRFQRFHAVLEQARAACANDADVVPPRLWGLVTGDSAV